MYEQMVTEKPLTGVWTYLRSKGTWRCSRCGCEVLAKDIRQVRSCPKCKASMRKAG